jgi:hypothetical protein
MENIQMTKPTVDNAKQVEGTPETPVGAKGGLPAIDATKALGPLQAVVKDAVRMANTVMTCVSSEIALKIRFFGLTAENFKEITEAKAFKGQCKAFNATRMAAFAAWLRKPATVVLLAQLDSWAKGKKNGKEFVNLQAVRIEDHCSKDKVKYSARYSASYNVVWAIALRMMSDDPAVFFANLNDADSDVFHKFLMAGKYEEAQARQAEREAEAEASKGESGGADGADKTDPFGDDVELSPEASDKLVKLFNAMGSLKKVLNGTVQLFDDLDVIDDWTEAVQTWVRDCEEVVAARADDDDDEASETAEAVTAEASG